MAHMHARASRYFLEDHQIWNKSLEVREQLCVDTCVVAAETLAVTKGPGCDNKLWLTSPWLQSPDSCSWWCPWPASPVSHGHHSPPPSALLSLCRSLSPWGGLYLSLLADRQDVEDRSILNLTILFVCRPFGFLLLSLVYFHSLLIFLLNILAIS